MEKAIEYKSTIKSRPFLYLETRKVADLLTQGLQPFEIKDKAIQANLFQVKTEARKREIAAVVLARLKHIDDYLLENIAHADVATSKFLVLYSIMKTDRLFYEFMHEVVREKYILRDTILKDNDFTTFFDSKKLQSEKVASWNEYTFYKLQQVYIRILFEAGVLKNQKGDREMAKLFVHPDVKKHIHELDEKTYIDIVEGE